MRTQDATQRETTVQAGLYAARLGDGASVERDEFAKNYLTTDGQAIYRDAVHTYMIRLDERALTAAVYRAVDAGYQA